MVEVRQGIGTVAQLVERMFRIYEARGSTPLCSTFLATDPRNTAQDLSYTSSPVTQQKDKKHMNYTKSFQTNHLKLIQELVIFNKNLGPSEIFGQKTSKIP